MAFTCRYRLIRLTATALPWTKLGTTSLVPLFSTSLRGESLHPSSLCKGLTLGLATEGLTGIDVSPAGVERDGWGRRISTRLHPFSRCRLLVGRRSWWSRGIVLLLPLPLGAGGFVVHRKLCKRQGGKERLGCKNSTGT